jgi:hypothetical protein
LDEKLTVAMALGEKQNYIIEIIDIPDVGKPMVNKIKIP